MWLPDQADVGDQSYANLGQALGIGPGSFLSRGRPESLPQLLLNLYLEFRMRTVISELHFPHFFWQRKHVKVSLIKCLLSLNRYAEACRNTFFFFSPRLSLLHLEVMPCISKS